MRLAHTSAVLAMGIALSHVPAALAAETLCKHNSPTSNIECRPRTIAEWYYHPVNHYGGSPPFKSLWSEDAAVAFALNLINSGVGYNNFCSYDYVRVASPYVATLWSGGVSTAEKAYPVTDGIVWAGNYCATGIVLKLEVRRNRDVYCEPGWFNGYDGLGGFLCYRDSNSPPSCPVPGGPMDGGGGAAPWSAKSDPAWSGNPVNAHTGDKVQTEVDFTSGGFRPLELRRTYSSTGFPWLINSAVPDVGMSSFWRLGFHHRLVQYTGATYTTMIAARADNSALYFYRSGAAWTGRAEQTESLADDLDAGGVVVSRTLTLSDNSREIYDLSGRLVQIQDPSGWSQQLGYDGGGRLQSVTDTLGRVLTFSYDSAGKLASIAMPDQQTISYDFNDRGNLTTVTYPGGGQKQYLYREAAHIATNSYGHLLTGIVDENGDRYATYKYNSAGKVSQTEHGNGAQRYQFTYGTSATIVDPLGTTRTLGKTNIKGFARTTSVSQPCAGCGGAAASALTYDALGNVASRTDFRAKKTCYAYDTTRNLETARLDGATSAENCTTVLATPPNRPDVRKVTTTWHPTWRLPATITEPAPGGTKTTTFTYDASGNLTQKSIAAPKNDGSGTTITRTWSWTYGTLGRVLTATDPNGKVTTTTWHSDSDPDLGKRGQVATLTNPLGHVTQYTAYDAGNRLTSMTDPNGLVSTMSYDLRGRLTSRRS